MADTEQLELAIGLAWVVALPVTVLWTLWAMHRQPNHRKALAALLFVALPGVLMGVDRAKRLIVGAQPGRPLLWNAYESLGVGLSCFWSLVGPLFLIVLRFGPVEMRAPTSLTLAHTVLWALTTLVGLRIAVAV